MGKIKIDNYTAKEAMQLVVKYMQLESVQTIEMVTSDTLKYYQNASEKSVWKEDAFDLTMASSRAVLEAAGITDETLLAEAESRLFMKMFMRFLHKNRVKVFLLAENETVLEKMKEFLAERTSGIQIIETATLEEHGVSDDMILNRINGAAADCIIAVLPSPQQEEFAIRNRLSMNARVWIGLGAESLVNKTRKSIIEQLKEFFIQHFTKM